jgi:hypothetical protein
MVFEAPASEQPPIFLGLANLQLRGSIQRGGGGDFVQVAAYNEQSIAPRP